jgi:hypothetical protein
MFLHIPVKKSIILGLNPEYLQRKYTDKKENQIFLIYKETQNGAVAKSYMTNGLIIYCAFLIY